MKEFLKESKPILYIIGACIALLIIFAYFDSKKYNVDLENCKSIGGKFIVVDQQFNGKIKVDVYGCVNSK